jgi:hypothetical protein
VIRSVTTPEAFDLGGTTTIRRLGFGTMQLPGPGVWGPQAIRVLRHAVDRGDQYAELDAEASKETRR